MQTLIIAIVVLVVLGLLIWAINAYAPIAQPFKGIVIVLLVLVACIYLLNLVGAF